MNRDALTFRSAIKPSLKKQTLFRGTYRACMGIILLLYGSIFLDEKILSAWGLPLFFLGMGLISWGMLPYRRLTRLEKHPDKLILTEDERLHYYRRGNHVLVIPFSSIEAITYVEKKRRYGVKIDLKKDSSCHASHMHPHLFFPYFSKRTVSGMRDEIL